MAHNAAAWLIDRHINEGRGDRIAVRCEGTETTYADLQADLFRVQNALTALGVSEGERVALVLNDTVTFPSWFLGAQRSGVVPVPLSTMQTGSELASVVADSQASVMVVSSDYIDRVGEIKAGAPALRTVVLDGPQTDPSSADIDTGLRLWGEFDDRSEVVVADTTVDSPAFWLYSSGTTGTPKGVMHVHGSLRATAQTYAKEVLQINEEDRFLSVAKLFFAYGLGNSLTFPFSVGATAILNPQRPNPQSFINLIRAERPTLFFASPGFLAGLLDAQAPGDVFASVRATMTAGESLPGDVQVRFAELSGKPVLDGIGTTELLHIFISNSLNEQTPGSSGKVVSGYVAELRNDDNEVVTESDTPGYLHVKGPSTARGYWQRDEATAAAFRDGWVRTGDVYTRSADDSWTFLGRNNDMIKAGGIWVSPAEVESALIEHPDVLEVAVVGARNTDGLESVVAFVVPASGANPSAEELDRHCRDRMAAFKRPRRIVIIDHLPRTATGKVQRFALRSQLEDAS